MNLIKRHKSAVVKKTEGAFARYKETDYTALDYIMDEKTGILVLGVGVTVVISILSMIAVRSPFFGLIDGWLGLAACYGFSAGLVSFIPVLIHRHKKKNYEWLVRASLLLGDKNLPKPAMTIHHQIDKDTAITIEPRDRRLSDNPDSCILDYKFCHNNQNLMSGEIGMGINRHELTYSKENLDSSDVDRIGMLILDLLHKDIYRNVDKGRLTKNHIAKVLDVSIQNEEVCGNHPAEMIAVLTDEIKQMKRDFKEADLTFILNSLDEAREYFVKTDKVSAALAGLLDYMIPKARRLCSYAREDEEKNVLFHSGLMDIIDVLNQEVRAEIARTADNCEEDTKQISLVVGMIKG